MCDEYMKLIDTGVCHRLSSIFVIDRASLFTDHRISRSSNSCQNINILEHFESILVTILQQISSLLLLSGGHRCME